MIVHADDNNADNADEIKNSNIFMRKKNKQKTDKQKSD